MPQKLTISRQSLHRGETHFLALGIQTQPASFKNFTTNIIMLENFIFNLTKRIVENAAGCCTQQPVNCVYNSIFIV